MPSPSLEDLDNLIDGLVLPFYQIDRDMPLPFANRRPENDAEHSWSVAFLACSLAPQIDPHLNLGKIAQFAIIHDVVEVVAGDTSIWGTEEELASKEAREKEAIKAITIKYPQFPWIAETIQEYEDKTSNEANFVWAVDKLVGVMVRRLDHEGLYWQEKKITKQRFDKDIQSHSKKAHAHAGVAQYYDQVLAFFHEHPEIFYAPTKES